MEQPTGSSLAIRTLAKLESLCRGEMSAAEAYTAALMHASLAPYSRVLRECQMSHAARAARLGERIEELGGRRPGTSGVWGALTEVVEEAAADLGPRPAIRALEEGEQHGLRRYYIDSPDLDSRSRELVLCELLPAQVHTGRRIRALRESAN